MLAKCTHVADILTNTCCFPSKCAGGSTAGGVGTNDSGGGRNFFAPITNSCSTTSAGRLTGRGFDCGRTGGGVVGGLGPQAAAADGTIRGGGGTTTGMWAPTARLQCLSYKCNWVCYDDATMVCRNCVNHWVMYHTAMLMYI